MQLATNKLKIQLITISMIQIVTKKNRIHIAIMEISQTKSQQKQKKKKLKL